MREIIIDGFAGGGGASTGIEMALGRSPDEAINHDPIAVGVHRANHPLTTHHCQSIWKVNPSEVAKGRKIGLAWFSPDCKHFSKAKGGKPLARNIRDLGWIVVAYARLPRRQRPRVIILENVEEWVTWGPLGPDGRPCPERQGDTFKRWCRALRREGYKVEWKELAARDFGTPTTRKRLFVIARNDGLPIVWPKETHGDPIMLPVKAGKLQPWRTAAEHVIDWSIPCPSIFDTSEEIMAKYGIRAIRPLAENTLARIARGVQRYVIEAADPFIVPITHTGDTRTYGIREQVRTITGAHRGEQALISPTLINTRNGERIGQEPRTRDVRLPYWTPTAQGSQGALVAAFLAQHNTDMVGHDARKPVSTLVGKGCTQAVVSAGLVNMKGTERRGVAPLSPAPTQTAGGWHVAEVRAFLMRYFGTQQAPDIRSPLGTSTTKERDAIVTVHGEPYRIVDIGMRMLTPRELFRAQGFPDSYIIDRQYDGTPVTKTDQIRLCGNSVCPQVAAALVAANYAEIEVSERGVPEFALQAAE